MINEKKLFKVSDIMRGQLDSSELKELIPTMIFYIHMCSKLNINTNLENFKLIEDKINSPIFKFFSIDNLRYGLSADERISNLSSLIEALKNSGIDFFNYKELGDVYELYMSIFSSMSKKSGEYYTPKEVSQLLKSVSEIYITDPNTVYDPTCGSGSLLSVFNDVKYFGQEKNPVTYNMCIMSFIMRGIETYNIANDDTLTSPKHLNEKFDVIVSNPPFSLKWFPPFFDVRYSYLGGNAPQGKGDWAFVQHVTHQLNANGVALVIVFPGILYRGHQEQKIREYFVTHNLIETIIQLPENIFYNTAISTSLLIIKKNKEDENILFVDATNEYRRSKKNIIESSHINNIVNYVKLRNNIDNISALVSKKSIENNSYNLSPSQYIVNAKKDEIIDIEELEKEIYFSELRILENFKKHREFMKELTGYDFHEKFNK